MNVFDKLVMDYFFGVVFGSLGSAEILKHQQDARNARTRHDMDSSWCPRLSAWDCRANRVFFSRALPRALIGWSINAY